MANELFKAAFIGITIYAFMMIGLAIILTCCHG